MKRDESGNIQFDARGEVEKFYPKHNIKSAMFWTCQRVSIRCDVERDYNRAIIAFRFVRGPHKIIDKGKSYKANKVEEYSDGIRINLTKFDIKSNCFGFVLLEGLFWIEPYLDCFIYTIPVIENILDSDAYKRIEYPEKNSIALFGKKNNFFHASKTNDGITWYGKVGVQKPCMESLDANIQKYGEVHFYKRVL